MKEESFVEEQELKRLLALWLSPDVPSSLDQKVLTAFRRQANESLSEDSLLKSSLPEHSTLSSPEEKIMKQCQTCQEEFAEKFSFCPVDGTPLQQSPEVEPTFLLSEETAEFPLAHNAYHLTIIEDAGLTRRLLNELGAAARASQLTWPEFKRDPFGFTRRSITAYGTMTWRFFSGPNVAIATLAAILFMMTAVIGLVWVDRQRAESLAKADRERTDIVFTGMVDIPDESEKRREGAAGMNKGDGGGSKPKQEKPGGGGGGGREDQNPVSKGKLPQADPNVPQVRGPDIKLPPIPNASLPIPPSLDLDKMLAKTDDRPIPYGMPNSISTTPSNGPGRGGGMGEGDGLGAGSGEDGGLGPGRGGNTGSGDRNMGGGGPGGGGGGGPDPNKIYKPGEVTTKARITSKPTPEYTEEARKNQVTGTVVLQMVLSSSGGVTNIRTVSGLPFGLTEKAIAAARRIQFTPATKEGRPVSQYIRVEYNFNIY